QSFLPTPPRPATPTLFPYTTLFRSAAPANRRRPRRCRRARGDSRLLSQVGLDHLRIAGNVRGTPFGDLLAVVQDHDEKIAEGRRSEEHTSELQSRSDLVCRLLLEKK